MNGPLTVRTKSVRLIWNRQTSVVAYNPRQILLTSRAIPRLSLNIWVETFTRLAVVHGMIVSLLAPASFAAQSLALFVVHLSGRLGLLPVAFCCRCWRRTCRATTWLGAGFRSWWCITCCASANGGKSCSFLVLSSVMHFQDVVNTVGDQPTKFD